MKMVVIILNISDLGLKELLFLFLNVKGYKITPTGGRKVCKLGNEIPDIFATDTKISNANKQVDSQSEPFDEDQKKQFVRALNTYYNFENYKFSSPTKAKIEMVFPNNDKLSISDFLGKLYNAIKSKQLEVSSENFSKYFAIAGFAFRGSFDLKLNFYTTDLHSSRVSTKADLERFIKLLILTDLNNQLNLNFRELQGEGTKRDTQFRINLKYFNDMYLDELKKVNPYRYRQFVLNAKPLERKSIKTTEKGLTGFLGRIQFYLKNIVGERDLDQLDIKNLRKRLNFSLNDGEKENKGKKRSNSAKEFAVLSKPEYCASCHNKYSNEERTFKMRNSNFWYFELHHVISFANRDIQTEDPDNYVKLCPACHRALTPRRANEDYQKQIISNILEDTSVLKYVENVEKTMKSTKEPVEFVYELLK